MTDEKNKIIMVVAVLFFIIGGIATSIYKDWKLNKSLDADKDADNERRCLMVASNIKHELWKSYCSEINQKPPCKLTATQFYELEMQGENKFNQCLSTLVSNP